MSEYLDGLKSMSHAGAFVYVPATQMWYPVSTLHPFPIAITDDIIGTPDAAAPTQGVQVGGRFEQVPIQVENNDFKQFMVDSFGNLFIFGSNRALQSIQTLEQAWDSYDVQAETARADAALPAGNAYDAAPVEIPTGDLKYCALWNSYERAAAGGGVNIRMEGAVTIGGADTWGRDYVRWIAGFAPAVDFITQIQRDEFQYMSTAAGVETGILYFDVSRADKIRIPCAEVLVGGGNEGDMEVLYKLSN